MAAQLSPARNERVVFLVSAAEKVRIADNARAASMTLSDFVRTAAQHPAEPTVSEQELLREMLVSLEEANARTDESLARLEATEQRAMCFDEQSYRQRRQAEYEAIDDLDWAAIADDLGLAAA